jgi:hypothetical protein
MSNSKPKVRDLFKKNNGKPNAARAIGISVPSKSGRTNHYPFHTSSLSSTFTPSLDSSVSHPLGSASEPTVPPLSDFFTRSPPPLAPFTHIDKLADTSSASISIVEEAEAIAQPKKKLRSKAKDKNTTNSGQRRKKKVVEIIDIDMDEASRLSLPEIVEPTLRFTTLTQPTAANSEFITNDSLAGKMGTPMSVEEADRLRMTIVENNKQLMSLQCLVYDLKATLQQFMTTTSSRATIVPEASNTNINEEPIKSNAAIVSNFVSICCKYNNTIY